MAIFRCQLSTISRSGGKSAVGKSAYRSAENIKNERDGEVHNYTYKASEIAYKSIRVPEHLSEKGKENLLGTDPQNERYNLWNSVEKRENRKDSRLARHLEIALPNELDKEQNIELLNEYIDKNWVSKGMVADVCFHDKNDGNPHAHIMLTDRPIDKDGEWIAKKDRSWNENKMNDYRQAWEDVANEHLAKAESLANENKGLFQPKIQYDRISKDTLEEQGINREPQIHVGVVANSMHQKGKYSERYEQNEEIKARNKERQSAEVEDKAISEELGKLEKQLTKAEKKLAKSEKKQKTESIEPSPKPMMEIDKPIEQEKPKPIEPKVSLAETIQQQKASQKQWEDMQKKTFEKNLEQMKKNQKSVDQGKEESQQPKAEQSKLKEHMKQDKAKEKQPTKPQQKESKFDFNAKKGDEQKEVKQQEKKAPQQQKKPKQKQQGRGR